MIVMTNKKVIQNQPCQLILDGTFSNLFPTENLSFDSEKGKFIIR
jgi:iron complex transport system ATP-binding protein